MDIEVKLYGTLKDYSPNGARALSFRMKIDGETRVQDILARLSIPDQTAKIILVNGAHGKKEQLLKEGDVLSVSSLLFGG